jgi:ABC-type antimicrobial peptide transport system permease subunit
MIVTEQTARNLWPDREPIGRTLIADLGRSGAIEFRVVGVARDAQITSIGAVDSTLVYVPAVPMAQPRLSLFAKGSASFEAMAAGIRAAAAELDPTVLVGVAPLEANVDFWRRLALLFSTLSTSLGMLALVLTAVGVYGIVSYAVGRSVREIGIRIALGATSRDVLSVLLRRTMSPVAVGAVIGLAMAVALSRVLSSVLFGVSPVDALGLGGAALFVLVVAVAAGILAAQPALRSDPVLALREE